MRVVTHDSRGSRVKGYPGSDLFREGSFIPDVFTLLSPTGKRVVLPLAGNAIQLHERGTWRVIAEYASDYTSGWSEDSGTITAADDLVLRFTVQVSPCL